MNKLRVLSWGGGGVVATLAVWAATYYGRPPIRFGPALVVGVVAAGLPFGLAYLKGAIRSVRRRLADPDEELGAERGSIFVSESAVEDPVDCLETVRSAVAVDDEYDEAKRDSFEDGPGLTVLHAGFHNSFVRVTGAGRVVVTGASERTHELAETVSEVYSLSFERTRDNPFDGIRPVRGAPRVFLGVVVFTLVLAGVNAVTVAAYPSDAYNPAERAVLVGVDARGAIDPSVSETETRLSKAAFLVAVVDETSTEVRWAQNDSERIAAHGEHALQASRDTRSLLAMVDDGSPTPEQRARVDQLKRRLSDAQRSVATALDERADSGALDETEPLSRLSDRLLRSANSSS